MAAPTEDIESELLVQEVLRRLESRVKETQARIAKSIHLCRDTPCESNLGHPRYL